MVCFVIDLNSLFSLDVIINFNNYDKIFNHFLNHLLVAVEYAFKTKIENVIDNALKSKVQTLIQSKLPLVIKI